MASPSLLPSDSFRSLSPGANDYFRRAMIHHRLRLAASRLRCGNAEVRSIPIQNLAHFGREIVQSKRLSKEVNAGRDWAISKKQPVGVAGHVEYFDFGMHRFYAVG